MLAKKRKFSATESMQVGNGPVRQLTHVLLPKGLHRWFDQLNLEKLDRAEVRSKYTDCTHKK
jgi:hypothetical protein